MELMKKIFVALTLLSSFSLNSLAGTLGQAVKKLGTSVFSPADHGKAGKIEIQTTANGQVTRGTMAVPPTDRAVKSAKVEMLSDEQGGASKFLYSRTYDQYFQANPYAVNTSPYEDIFKLSAEEIDGKKYRITSEQLISESPLSNSKKSVVQSHKQENGMTKLTIQHKVGSQAHSSADLLFPADIHVLHFDYDRILGSMKVYHLKAGVVTESRFSFVRADEPIVARRADRVLNESEIEKLKLIVETAKPQPTALVKAGESSRGMQIIKPAGASQ